MTRRPRSRVIPALVVAALAVGSAAAQDSLPNARELYASAAYEEALAALNRLRASVVTAEDGSTVERYRALCLLALGRPAEAQDAIAAVVTASPWYVPAEADASPRVRSAFSDVRRRLLPAVAQQAYAGAKVAFDRREFQAAAGGFAEVLKLLADPDLAAAANQPPLADVRTLARGFQDLSVKALEPPPMAPAQPGPATAPQAPAIYTTADADVVPPAAVRQAVPSPPHLATFSSPLVLDVVIDEHGAVESADLRGSVDPAYDRLVLEAARKWRYKPAMRGGIPVRYRKTIHVVLAPSPNDAGKPH